jgi:copper chaperone
MATLKFKSNIKCGGCIAKVTPVLNQTEGINKWEVDILTPEKILSVETETLKADDIIKAVASAGFKAEPLV